MRDPHIYDKFGHGGPQNYKKMGMGVPILWGSPFLLDTGASAIGDDGARLDISVNGLWGGRHEKTFIDVRIFNPHAPSNKKSTLSSCYRNHERLKKRAYEQRVREIEHASFTPLVLSATGGFAREATIFYKRSGYCSGNRTVQSYAIDPAIQMRMRKHGCSFEV